MVQRALRVLTCMALAALGACGGGSNPAAPTPTPTPRPTPTTRTVTEGTFTGLDADGVLAVPLQVLFTGEVQTVVDWTFASNDLDMAIAAGNFTCVDANNLFDPRICQLLAGAASANKPERFSAQLAAGSYTLYIENTGPGQESLSYQVLLTYTPTSGAPGAGTASLSGVAAPSPRLAGGAARGALRRALAR